MGPEERWLATQVQWPAQVKEAYGQRQAVCVVVPRTTPFASVILLCDNKNLSAQTDSQDQRVVRWQHDIKCSGCVVRRWTPGEWNTIADYGSRAVLAQPDAQLSEEEKFELHLYALLEEGDGTDGEPAGVYSVVVDERLDDDAETSTTLVPGHLYMAPMAAKIAGAQAQASEKERSQWAGGHYSTAVLGQTTLYLWKDRLVVPRDAVELKSLLMTMCHDGGLHYTGASRTQWALENQARVHWAGIADDVTAFVRSCFKCTMAKQSHVKVDVGTLNPTLAPYVHHTWYGDVKGPLPHDTGSILVFVEAISRSVKLRYLPNSTAKEVTEEFLEAIVSWGTRPVVFRSDGGPPFDSVEFKEFCVREGITPVKGAPHHSQGQGRVETKIREIANAIIATLGAKAPREWMKGDLLARLELTINSTVVELMGCSPYCVLNGREPRTALVAQCEWSSPEFGDWLGAPGVNVNDINEIIAVHHSVMGAVQERVLLGSSVQQALTKRHWDGTRKLSEFKVGDYAIVLVLQPNRLSNWYSGPYRVTRISGCNNFVYGSAFVDPAAVEHGPFHVSRLKPIDMSRATVDEVAAHQLEAGSGVVDSVLGHRVLADGSFEFEISWFGTELKSWVPSSGVRRVTKVITYCQENGLNALGTGGRVVVQGVAGRGRGRGRGRGGRGGRGQHVHFAP